MHICIYMYLLYGLCVKVEADLRGGPLLAPSAVNRRGPELVAAPEHGPAGEGSVTGDSSEAK